MNPTSHEETLFQAALPLAGTERAALLDRACAGDAVLRARVEALLAAHDQPDTVFGTEAGVGRPTISVDLAHDPLDDLVGQTIGRYKLLEKIGEGGCGVVYVAEQTEPVRRRVALKIIKLGMDTKQVVARFEAERQALAMMDHPNIAKVLDAGTTEGGKSEVRSSKLDGRELMSQGLDARRRTIREEEPPRPSTRLTQELARLGLGSARGRIELGSARGFPLGSARASLSLGSARASRAASGASPEANPIPNASAGYVGEGVFGGAPKTAREARALPRGTPEASPISSQSAGWLRIAGQLSTNRPSDLNDLFVAVTMQLLADQPDQAAALAGAYLKGAGLADRLLGASMFRVVSYLAGQLDEEALLKAATSAFASSTAHHFVGLRYLQRRDLEAARRHLQRSSDTGEGGGPGAHISALILQRLDADDSWPPTLPRADRGPQP